MEGMYDGGASDDCFVCGLLFPERYDSGCPRCHNRMRYHAAVHMDYPSLERTVMTSARRYQQAAQEDKAVRLEELLALLHRFSPESLNILHGATELELPQLRNHWQTLTGV